MKGDGTSHIKVGLSGRPSKAKTSLKVGSGGNLKAASNGRPILDPKRHSVVITDENANPNVVGSNGLTENSLGSRNLIYPSSFPVKEKITMDELKLGDMGSGVDFSMELSVPVEKAIDGIMDSFAGEGGNSSCHVGTYQLLAKSRFEESNNKQAICMEEQEDEGDSEGMEGYSD